MREEESVRIAFIGVSHWHVPLYFQALEKRRLNIVAVCDSDLKKVKPYAEKYKCACYTDEDLLLEEIRPEFIFAFAQHDQMPNLAKKLIDRKIAFAMEKPFGLCEKDVKEIRNMAEHAGVFCTVPFVWRYSELIQNFKKRVKPDEIIHMAFKFVAGPPSRYLETSPWMLQKDHAGGGCMTNLGVHFIDMAMFLTESTDAEVIASNYHYESDYDIETYATALVKLSSGATLLLETGYAFPMDSEQRDNRWNIVTRNGYYTLGDNCFEERVYGEKTIRTEMSTNSDVYYPKFVIETIRQYLEHEKPYAGLDEMCIARNILDQMNKLSK